MPKKKTLQEVKDRISELSNDTVKLLSDTYVNNRTKMDLQCKCNRIFQRDFEHINRGQIFCPVCSQQIVNDSNRYNIDYIKEEIAKTGCEYISGEYINSDSKLYIRCRCGKLFYKSWGKFHSGQDHCPECGMKALADAKRIYDDKLAKEKFKQYGYIMIGPFLGAAEKTPCLCQNGHECGVVLSQLPSGRSGCRICAIEAKSGENHWNYKGGVSLIEDAIRHRLSDWKQSVRSLYDGKCPITGSSGLDADVHHLFSLSTLYNQVMHNHGLSLSKRDSINEFENSEIGQQIIQEIVDLHKISDGILIDKEIHQQFHKEYGYGDNTPQQFDDFLIKNYNISLYDILRTEQKGGV